MRILLAGASGVIGVRLVPLLAAAGHTVGGMTRTPSKAQALGELGAEPIVCDVYDAANLKGVTADFGPDLVMHQLTDLPDSAADLSAYGSRSRRMREEGTRNLLAAAKNAGVRRFIAQSISWEHPSEVARTSNGAFEQMVLAAGGVVVRYGMFYGPGTYYPGEPPASPRIHIDDAARLTLPVLDAPGGITVVIDDRALR
jgi:nucleoside-diphosphate-sugar epimerase